MAIPSRPKQIARIAEFLEDPANDERSVTDVAKLIVDGMYDMWTRGESSPPIPLTPGLAFKAPMVSKIYHVGWMGDMWWGSKLGTVSTVWIITADSDYGTVMPVGAPFWRVVTPSTAKSGAPGNNADGWKPGDKVSMGQRAHSYEIVAAGDKSVLMHKQDHPVLIHAESNAGLKKNYRREN
jgi:hypothetical protein